MAQPASGLRFAPTKPEHKSLRRIDHDQHFAGCRSASSFCSRFFRGREMSRPSLVATILDVMEWDRAYDTLTLKALCPGTSMDALGEALHALWIDRRVERVGISGWRRFESCWDGTPREESRRAEGV
jgi:hypothetical protein